MTSTASLTNRILPLDDLRMTRYSDVCGGTDELKRLLTEAPDAATTPEGRAALRGLVDDGLYMLARMEIRLREYQAFRDELARIVEHMRTLDEPRLADAAAEAERIRTLLAADGDLPLQEVADRAEEIRQVANDMEGALRRHKEACIAAGKAYLQLKGPRDWEDGSQNAATPAPEVSNVAASVHGDGHEPLPAWIPEAWLPPPPHREKIVDWLKRGRAALLSDDEVGRLPVGPQGREPLVQFEDGGFMPLRVVRWNEEVRNFHPLGQDPHPRGRLYRKRVVGPAAPPTDES